MKHVSQATLRTLYRDINARQSVVFMKATAHVNDRLNGLYCLKLSNVLVKIHSYMLHTQLKHPPSLT